ncbi:DUF2877 domain-containing protein [Thermovenabulum gondwanense]|uniref:DUF2877 domain-containing protein n=1 Tax=Thermovenabulum gondwanense TaxID=520767 RepID=A0A162MNV8_9FIRM|nr:DUF2877 domain-containing protein [Thermovenabulum gondwanense]KYO66818.1 hypothetical protein ATZ99_10630 [Thermovenabulum gondwanense]
MIYITASAGKKALRILSSRKKGKIHSVFKNAINILFDNELIGIVKKDDFLNFYNISISFTGNFETLPLSFEGSTVHFHDDILFFNNTPFFYVYDINIFNPFCYFSEHLNEKNLSYDKKSLLSKISLLESIANEELSKYDDLTLAVRKKIVNLEEEELSSMIGLGPGLTPAFDDFLSGYMMAKNFMSFLIKKQIFRAFKENLKLIRKSKNKTNIVSYQMLKTAAMFGGPKLVIDLLISLFHPDELGSIEDNFHKLLKIGATSGCFWALGIIDGIKKFKEV